MLAFGTSTATTAPAMLGGTSARAYLGDYLKQPAIYFISAATTRRRWWRAGATWLN